MALFDNLVKLMPKLNGIEGKLGANKFSVTVRSTTTSNRTDYFKGKASASSVTELQLLEDSQNPGVNFLKQEAVARGVAQDALILVGPITPAHSGGGYAVSALVPTGKVLVEYVLNGPGYSNAIFELDALITDDPLAYYLKLKRR